MDRASCYIVLKMFYDLIRYCENKEKYDFEIFAIYHDNYAKLWSKLSIEQQGFISEVILNDSF